jgi:hypothetical protein
LLPPLLEEPPPDDELLEELPPEDELLDELPPPLPEEPLPLPDELPPDDEPLLLEAPLEDPPLEDPPSSPVCAGSVPEQPEGNSSDAIAVMSVETVQIQRRMGMTSSRARSYSARSTIDQE